MTRFPSLIARVLGTLVVAGLVLVGMPMSPASAAALDHFTIVANSTPVTEGNAGTTDVTFTISYSGNPNPVTVDWATVDGTATAGSDYVAASGTAIFTGLPSDRTRTVTVQVKGDTTYEGNETFTVHLSNNQPSLTTAITTADATQTITDDETAPALSVDDVNHAEGDTGSTTYTFTVSQSFATAATTTVNYATADGTATTADSDYTSASGVLTFTPGQTSKTFDVTVNGDTKNEADETFAVDLSGATNATISDGQGIGTITNDDAVPTISVDDQTVGEGDVGTTTMTFHVTLSNPSGKTVTVDWATNDGTATTSDNDYVAGSGTLTFTPGQTSKTVDVTINGDTKKEADQDLTLDLTNPTNATISDGSGLGTITNDDPIPDASIADTSVTEGNAGTSTMSFDVTLSHPSDDTVSVDWATSDGTATTSDNDYVAASGTVTFGAGETSKSVDVTVNGDTTYEADQGVTVTLTNPVNAGLADDTATGTISNDDQVPDISIDDQTASEGDAGTSTMTFHVTLSNPSDGSITVDYATNDGTATAGSDYEAASGTVTFDPGDTSKTVDVTIDGDTTHEANEDFTVVLSNPIGTANLLDDSGSGAISNDDQVPDISIDDQSANEGNTGDAPILTFNVTLSNPSDETITVDYTTNNGTATVADGDYTTASGTVTFDPGDTAKTIAVTLTGDDVPELDETLTVDLSAPSGANLLDDSGVGTITNDDAAAQISILDASVLEGNGGDSVLSFDVGLSKISAGTITVGYATSDGTAKVADGDYDAASGTVTFLPGEDLQQVDVTIHGDTTYENDEAFTVGLTSPVGGTIAIDSATGTITNDDAPPALSIGDVTKDEGNSGTTAFVFTVTKLGATELPASVAWTTGGGDATPTSDYASASGTLNFSASQTTKTITVLVQGDTTFEADQTFDVTLSSEVGATLSLPIAIGTITNDDKEPATLTLHRRLTGTSLIARGLLERGIPGSTVRVALFHKVNGAWVRTKAKTVTIGRIKDRDGDLIPEGRYRAVFPRPSHPGNFRLRARFGGSPTQTRALSKLLFLLKSL